MTVIRTPKIRLKSKCVASTTELCEQDPAPGWYGWFQQNKMSIHSYPVYSNVVFVLSTCTHFNTNWTMSYSQIIIAFGIFLTCHHHCWESWSKQEICTGLSSFQSYKEWGNKETKAWFWLHVIFDCFLFNSFQNYKKKWSNKISKLWACSRAFFQFISFFNIFQSCKEQGTKRTELDLACIKFTIHFVSNDFQYCTE